jgi:hypothetical protein
MRPRLLLVAAAVVIATAGCRRDGDTSSVLIGRPAGPYRATLRLEPDHPRAGDASTVILAIEDARTSKPVSDLQVVHERMVHSFLVSRDFRHFAHTHHEDFAALRPEDVAAATFRYPHVFPFSGGYELVIEFTHRDRTWIKRFDFVVGEEAAVTPPRLEPRREAKSGGYRFSLSVDPDPPVAGKEARLVCRIETAAGEPVTDLEMVLGSEVHLATWRNDGEHFGHTHAWTPEMAAMMSEMAAMGHDTSPGMSAMMMATPAVQHFHGPEVPLRHVFPEPGDYAIFLDLAPGGRRTVADFALRVEP